MSLYKIMSFMPRRTLASKPPISTSTPPAKQDTNNKIEVTETDNHANEEFDMAKHTGQTSVNMNHDGVGFKSDKYTDQIYLNPLLTPPPRSPRTPEDFMNPSKLGHWSPLGFDYTNPVRDKYMFHETLFFSIVAGMVGFWMFFYGPDFKEKEWAQREAFLRTAKREALGLPLIDRNVINPERIVLPTEEELGNFIVTK